MAKIKSISDIAEKFTRVTPMRAEDYRKGIASPRVDWAAATAAAEANYKDGVTAAAARGAFGKGVRTAGTAKWQRKALEKGPSRFSEGVQLAGPDYEAGFKPYHDVLSAIVLPPKAPKGDPRNIQRVATVAAALRARKVGK